MLAVARCNLVFQHLDEYDAGTAMPTNSMVLRMIKWYERLKTKDL